MQIHQLLPHDSQLAQPTHEPAVIIIIIITI
jgi:hypothetical protein